MAGLSRISESAGLAEKKGGDMAKKMKVTKSDIPKRKKVPKKPTERSVKQKKILKGLERLTGDIKVFREHFPKKKTRKKK